MTTTYEVADMMIGVRNMIEAADLRQGDQVLLLADTRSDKTTMEALTAGLRFFGAEPMTLVTEPIARYGSVPQPVLEAMHAVRCGHLGVAGVHHIHTGASRHGPQARGKRHPVARTENETLPYLLRRQCRTVGP